MNASHRKTRLLTFNIAHGRGLSLYQGFHKSPRILRNLDRIATLIRATGADIVALQEVDQSSHWNKHIDLLSYLREATDYGWTYMSVHNRREGKRPLAYGNGLLAQHPIEDAETQAFGRAPLGEKGFHYAEVVLPNGRLPLINLHLDFRSRKRRIEQIEQIIAFLQMQSERERETELLPPVVCGDFNSTSAPARDAVAHLFRFLQTHEAYQVWPKGSRTFPAHFPQRGLDFIFIPHRYEVHCCQVIRSFTSDHLPVLVEFSLPETLKSS